MYVCWCFGLNVAFHHGIFIWSTLCNVKTCWVPACLFETLNKDILLTVDFVCPQAKIKSKAINDEISFTKLKVNKCFKSQSWLLMKKAWSQSTCVKNMFAIATYCNVHSVITCCADTWQNIEIFSLTLSTTGLWLLATI